MDGGRGPIVRSIAFVVIAAIWIGVLISAAF
jgi:hypothetical protein